MKYVAKHLWRTHTANLLSEILTNPGTEQLRRPIQIFAKQLQCVAERAIALHDPILDALMLHLTLYEQADPASPNYDPAALSAACALLLRDKP